MTVLLALRTQEGIVFASDSRETFYQGGGLLIRDGVQKIFQLGQFVLYGASGEVGMGQRVTEALVAKFKGEPGRFHRRVSELKIFLRDLVFPIMKDTADHSVRVQGLPEPRLEIIFCGFTDDTYWILGIDARGCVEEHTSRGFCAAGSGGLTGQFAVQCLGHLEIPQRRLFQGELVAFRVIDDVIRTGDPFVGGEVQMFVLTAEGSRQIDSSILMEIRNTVGVWKQAENQVLGELKQP